MVDMAADGPRQEVRNLLGEALAIAKNTGRVDVVALAERLGIDRRGTIDRSGIYSALFSVLQVPIVSYGHLDGLRIADRQLLQHARAELLLNRDEFVALQQREMPSEFGTDQVVRIAGAVFVHDPIRSYVALPSITVAFTARSEYIEESSGAITLEHCQVRVLAPWAEGQLLSHSRMSLRVQRGGLVIPAFLE